MTDKTGCLIIDLKDKALSPEEREIINHPLIGGIILFGRNYESHEQITHLCREIRSARKSPGLIMVDQEGGRVQRFINEFTRLPFMAALGKLYDADKNTGCQMAKDCGWLMASELLAVGVDISLSPVLDLNKGVSSVIGNRAFHANPEYVISIASAFMSGMHEAGMRATGKHFPGHGSVQLDSHVANPIDERSLEEIEIDDLLPFAGLIKAGIPAIMAAHIVFPKADKLPVGYSRYWLQDILREKMGFKGVIMSDDLTMEGANISSNYVDRVKTAREAGCDYTLVCNNQQAVAEVLDHLPTQRYLLDEKKRENMQATVAVNQRLVENPRWKRTSDELNKLNNNWESQHGK